MTVRRQSEIISNDVNISAQTFHGALKCSQTQVNGKIFPKDN